MDIQHYIKERQARIERVLESQLTRSTPVDSVLNSAMAYSVLDGGKRLRPLLAYASAEALGASTESADVSACAVEFIHSYSLIHDDLPAMDNDLLRRGKATCHVAFNEATAILAGDALQGLAFELLAESSLLKVSDSVRLSMIQTLSQAIGWKGMVAGQSIDFQASGTIINEPALAQMHSLKTGALISASVKLGALSTGIVKKEQLQALEMFSKSIGLAFQVQDDILDVESATEVLGKQQGKDQSLNKPTYTSILGLEGAKRKAAELCDNAISALDEFGDNADPLIGLARYIIRRNH